MLQKGTGRQVVAETNFLVVPTASSPVPISNSSSGKDGADKVRRDLNRNQGCSPDSIRPVSIPSFEEGARRMPPRAPMERFCQSSILRISATQCSASSSPRTKREDVEHHVGETADVQDVLAVRRLDGPVRLEVQAGEPGSRFRARKAAHCRRVAVGPLHRRPRTVSTTTGCPRRRGPGRRALSSHLGPGAAPRCSSPRREAGELHGVRQDRVRGLSVALTTWSANGITSADGFFRRTAAATRAATSTQETAVVEPFR